jgi:hypothetical protein
MIWLRCRATGVIIEEQPQKKRTPAVAVNDPPGAGDRRGFDTTGVVFILPNTSQEHNPPTAIPVSES